MLMNILRFLLLPVSFIYGIIIDIRTWLYRKDLLKSYKYPVPVISIGNITAGGAGKTPFTIFLAEKLKDDYGKIAVVSRGYGRSSTGMHLVSNGEKILLKPEESGDEPYLIAVRQPDIFVIVSEQRNLAIEYMIENHDIDLIIMDDAFQHLKVRRDADIVLINMKESYHAKWMLPTGSLREFRHNLSRADIVLLTNSDKPAISTRAKLLGKMRNIYNSRFLHAELTDIQFKPAGNLDMVKDRRVFAFAGIAHPENFERALIKKGLQITEFQSYEDHFRFTEEHMRGIVDQCKQKKCKVLLCTEKDLVKVAHVPNMEKILQENGLKLFGLRMEMEIYQYEDMYKKLREILDKSI